MKDMLLNSNTPPATGIVLRDFPIDDLPRNARDLVNLAARVAWNVIGERFADADGSPFFTIQFWRPMPIWHVIATWHSRPTGGRGYRLTTPIYRHIAPDGIGSHHWRNAPSLRFIRQLMIDNPVRPLSGEGNAA